MSREKNEQSAFPGDPVLDQLVANTLGDLLAELDRSVQADYTPPSSKSGAQAAIGAIRGILAINGIGQHSNSGRSTAPEMLEILSPLAAKEVDLPYKTGDKFREFVDDLELLALFEQGGIDGLNRKLDNSLKVLQEAKLTTAELEKVIGEVNNILCRAIYLFPHLVSGVEVKVGESAAANGESLRRKYYEPNRFYYEGLIEKLAERGDVSPSTLIIPLPYGFTTGTHGSGERAAMGASRMDIFFSFASRRDSPASPTPCLKVTIEPPLIVARETTFLTDEIESVRLTGHSPYTPYFDDRHRDGPLITRGNHVTCYLTFRDFANYGTGRYLAGETKPIVLEPYKNTRNLWQVDYRVDRDMLRLGYFAIYDESAEKMVLYQVRNFPVQRGSEDKIAEIVADVLAREAKPDDQAVTRSSFYDRFVGDNAIRHLAQIPVVSRNF